MTRSTRKVPLPADHPGHQPTVDSVWRCPCGREGVLSSIAAHRRHKAKHPECEGDIEFLRPGTGIKLLPYRQGGYRVHEEEDAPAASPSTEKRQIASPDTGVATPVSPGKFTELLPDLGSFTEGPLLGEDDPESVAREINRQRTVGASGGGGAGSGRFGGGLAFFDGDLPPGIGGSEWEIEPPAGIHAPTQDRVAVSLPVVFKVWYDVMVEMGWWQGDGSLSAWVVDMVSNHFAVCCDLMLAAMRRSAIYPPQMDVAEESESVT